MSEAAAKPQRSSLWCSRLAVFAVVVILAAVLLHRFFGMPTAVALNLVATGFALAAAAVLLGLIATIGVWRTGRAGAARILLGTTLGLAVLAVPASVMVLARGFPVLNDVTTDALDPPALTKAAPLRTGLANPAAYPGEAAFRLQRKAYPDLQPLDVNRSPGETFELVVDALKRLQMTVVAEDPPSEANEIGRAEAVDRTLVMGFYDDVAVRVMPHGDPEQPGSRIDLRSSSRYGRSDFGANAQRLRAIMREIVARLEATTPAAGQVPTANKKTLKPGKTVDREKAGDRTQRDDARTNARRERERRAPPP